MTAEDFSAALCAEVIRRGVMAADGAAHVAVESAARELFPRVRAELRREWDAESEAGRGGDPFPQRP